MTASIFARTLASAAMLDVFADRAIVAAMLRFEAALAEAEAAEGVIPAAAVAPIVAACGAEVDVDVDVEAIVAEARSAGSLAIPLVRRLTAAVAARDAAAAGYVHWGSTSQDAIDTAMVLVTGRALDLIEAELDRLAHALTALARAHEATPVLARTLLQPAQVVSFGFKVVAWLAPLLRSRKRLARAREAALRLQFGGAVGTLATLGEKGAAVARRLGERLGLPAGDAWHVQRDDWVALACEVAVLCGSLAKIGTDLALLAQAEVGEVAEPTGEGRGGSSAMPHKRNPVAAMTAIAAGVRAPQHAATLLAAMRQAHERGLGDWQAELAEWPSLFLAAHGALVALADAIAGLEVDAGRMRDNIARQRGTVFAEAAAALLAPTLGKAKAGATVAALAGRVARGEGDLAALARADPAFAAIDAGAIDAAFDADAAARRAGRLAAAQLDALAHTPIRSGDSPMTAPDRSDDFERGLANRRAVLGDEWVDRSLAGATDFNADFQSLITRYAWYEIWGRPGLDHDTRRLLVLGMTMGMARWEEFELHCRAAIRGGVSVEKIQETLLQGAIYCGVPAANTAFKITGEILRAEGRTPAPASLAAASRVATHHTLSAPQLRVAVQGKGLPVVLSHALGLDLHMWDALARRLAPQYTVLRYDQRGHGESAQPPGPYAMDDLVDDAARAIREWGQGPVAWIGLSMGGMVGQGLAVRHPELLRGAVLANTTARYPDAARPTWAARIAAVEQGGMAAVADAVVERYLHADHRAAHPDVAAALRARLLRTDPAAYVACCHAVANVDWLDRLQAVRLPTLVIAGARDVGATPEMARAIAERIAGAELRVFADASHLSVVEVGDEFHAAVSSFLASLPASR